MTYSDSCRMAAVDAVDNQAYKDWQTIRVSALNVAVTSLFGHFAT